MRILSKCCWVLLDTPFVSHVAKCKYIILIFLRDTHIHAHRRYCHRQTHFRLQQPWKAAATTNAPSLGVSYTVNANATNGLMDVRLHITQSQPHIYGRLCLLNMACLSLLGKWLSLDDMPALENVCYR